VESALKNAEDNKREIEERGKRKEASIEIGREKEREVMDSNKTTQDKGEGREER